MQFHEFGKDRDRIIVIFYIDVGSIDKADAYEYIEAAAKCFRGYFDDTVKPLFVATNEGGNRVDCINPRLLSEEEYKTASEKIKLFESEYEKFLKEIKEQENASTHN